MTQNILPWYYVTVSHGVKIGSRRYRAKAQLLRKDTNREVGEPVFGEGGAMTTADRAAIEAAKNLTYRLGRPDDWTGPVDGFTF